MSMTWDDSRVLMGLNLAIPAMRKAATNGLEVEAERQLSAAQRRTPVEFGDLVQSGTRHRPVHTPSDVSVTISFGDEDVDYAIPVHERLELKHPIGQAKYLESVVFESTRSFSQNIGAVVKAEMGMVGF